jgi:hypothetical protein
MRAILRSGFFWQFVGGFALGTVGVVSLHPSEVAHTITHHFEARSAPTR